MNKRIKSVEKEDRKDISSYLATLTDGSQIGVEAKSKAEATKQVEEFLESEDGKRFYPAKKDNK